MSITKYEVLLKAAELQNITKAADALGYTQSGVSQMLNSLEQELGITLLNRNRNGVFLTSAGESLLPYFRNAVNADRQIREMAADINGLKAGLLRIALMNSVSVHYLPNKLRKFSIIYPDISFEFLQGSYSDIEKWISDGTVDCGFVCIPTKEKLDTIELINDPYYCISAKDHRFKDFSRVPLGEMRDEDFVQTDISDYDFSMMFEEAGFTPRIRYNTENDYATIAMVQQGMGIAIMPALIIRYFRHTLCVKKLEEPHSRTIAIAVKSMAKASPLAKAFIDFLITK